MKGLTLKQKQTMEKLGKENNSLRFFKVGGVWYEITGTKIFGNGSSRHDIKPSYKGLDYITSKDYLDLIKQHEDENKHLKSRIKELQTVQ
jgi:hypothetical protein